MTARLILVRHGNTFKPDETPVWVGARSDLPLVEKGLAQARALGDALKTAKISPSAFVCGPLQRTREAARIAAELIDFPAASIKIDERLTEIDYGAWEGKATPEIEAAGGGAELAAWNKLSLYPTNAGWQPTEDRIITDVATFIADTGDGDNIVVTSNGILRFFARAAINADDVADRKVATGNVCIMTHTVEGWRIERWNQPPHFCFQS